MNEVDQRVLLNGQGIGIDGSLAQRDQRTKILIGIRDLPFHQEVLDWLGRDFRVEVVGATAEPEQLVHQLTTQCHDVTVLCPTMAELALHPSTRSQRHHTLLVAQEMTVPLLREAIELGVHGVFAWPDERQELSAEIGRSRVTGVSAPAVRGQVIAVVGARGGAGTTFLATHLAAELARSGSRCVLVDLEARFGGMTVALGIRSEGRIRTITDLLPVVDELSPEHVRDALTSHPTGFAALLAPSDAPVEPDIPARLYARSVALLSAEFQAVILHVPRDEAEVARRAIELSDVVLLVTPLDLLSMHGAKRMMPIVLASPGSPSPRVVLNRVARGDVTPSDVERALALRPWEAIRFDPHVRRVQDRGELLPARSRRAGKDVRRLARALRKERTAGRRQEGD